MNTITQLIASCPPGADLYKYLAAHLKALYLQHLEQLKVASQKDNPLATDACDWLDNAKQLALSIKGKGLTINPIIDGYVGRLAAVNVPKESALLRQMATKPRS